jgi:hypothetical protein
MITNRDYQAAKRWIEENLFNQGWYMEYPTQHKKQGRKGVIIYIGVKSEAKPKPVWGDAESN